MKCPNITSKEWLDLVKEHGAVEARNLYIKNNYEIPTTEEEINRLKADLVEEPIKHRLSKETQKLIDIKEKALAQVVSAYNAYRRFEKLENIKPVVESLERIIKKFESDNIIVNTLTIFDNIHNILFSLEKKIDTIDKSGKEGVELSDELYSSRLNQAKDLLNSFNILNDILEYAQQSDEIDPKFLERIERTTSDLKKRTTRLNNRYNAKIKDFLATKLGKISTIKRFERKEELRKEYQLNNPRNTSNLTKAEYDLKLNSFINRTLSIENTKLLQSEMDYVYDLLETSPKDITNIMANLVDPRNMTGDHVIQLIVKMFDDVSYDIREKFLKERDLMAKAFEKFTSNRKSKGITDQIKLYGDILERDAAGNLTGFLTSPFTKTYQQALENTMELARNNPSQKEEIWKSFNRTYRNFPDTKGMTKKEKRIALDYRNLDTVKDEYITKQYKNIKQDAEMFEFYTFLIDYNKKADKLLKGTGKRLGLKLPAITANTNEIIKKNGIIAALKNWWKESTKIQADDESYAGLLDADSIITFGTKGGRQYRSINIPFRGDIPIEDQSFDLAGMYTTNMYTSLNYYHKNKIKNTVELTKDIVGSRDFEKADPGSLKKIYQVVKKSLSITDEEEKEIITRSKENGDLSNAYKALSGIIETRLYGISNLPGGTYFINPDKATQTLLQLASHNFLIGNFAGATSNLISGKVMNFLGGQGSYGYTNKNLLKGEKKYFTDFFGKNGIVNDIGQQYVKNKTNILSELLYGDNTSFNGFANDFTKDNRLKRIAGIHTLHGLNNTVEHYIQGTLMYGVLNSYRMKDINNNYVNKEGQIVSREEAITLDEVIDINEDKKIIFPENMIIEGLENENPSEAIKTISRKLKDIAADLQGNYSQENKTMISRHWYGKLFEFMRKFLIRGFDKRYKGFQYFKKDELELHELNYSESQQDIKEGTYISMLRFLYKIKKSTDKLSLELLSENWNNLSDKERGNIRHALWEIGLMVSSLIAANLLANIAEDDDEEVIWASAYALRRLWGDLSFYTPVAIVSGESTRLLETPTASLSLLKTMGVLVDSAIDDILDLEFHRFASGKRAGEVKTLVYLNKLVNPIDKHLVNMDYKSKYQYITNPNY